MNKVSQNIIDKLNKRFDQVVLNIESESWTGLDILNKINKTKDKFGSSKYVCISAEVNFESIILVLTAITESKVIVPLNPNQPADRLIKSISQLGNSVWVDNNLAISISSLENNFGISKELNSFYILFTSGSTGQPKGVSITEENILNTLTWSFENFGRDSESVVGLVAQLYFDIGLFELIYSFYFGLRLVVISDSRNPFKSTFEICEHGVTTIFSAPSFFNQISSLNLISKLSSDSKLNSIISGGDFLPVDTAKKWIQDSNCILRNVWGPSETSVVNTCYKVDFEDIIEIETGKIKALPIGYSSEKMEVVVINKNDLKCSPMENGELTVLGDGVGEGYLDPDISSGFTHLFGKRAFKTGDIGFIDFNRKIHIVGRSANLIKINGFRIDPREIEFWLEKIEIDANACVLTIEDINSNLQLVAAIGSRNISKFNIEIVKNYLRSKLPPYMIPKKIFFFKELPLNSNGKIDKLKIKQLLMDKSD